MTRSSRLARTGAAAGLVAGAVLLGGCGAESADADAVIAARSDDVEGSASAFVVPPGTLTVTVGDPVDEVSQDDTADRDAWSAPDGSSLLPVLVDFAYEEGAPWGGLLAAEPQGSDVTVSVDGEQRDLGSPYQAQGQSLSGSATAAYYVVVPGDPAPEDVTIEVAYDGASQSAAPGDDPTGPAARLAELPTDTPGGAACPSGAWRSSEPDLRVECELPTVGRTPYWPGSGWAPDDSSWAVVGVRRLQVYPAAGSADEVRSITGSGATEALEHGDWGPTGLTGVVVVDSSELRGGALTLEVRADVDGPTSVGRPATLTCRVPVPAEE